MLRFKNIPPTFVSHLRNGGYDRNKLKCKSYREMEQLVARRAHNPKVAGSSPALATTKTACF